MWASGGAGCSEDWLGDVEGIIGGEVAMESVLREDMVRWVECGVEVRWLLSWGWMGGCMWAGDNGECLERGDDDEEGGGIWSEEWLVWKLAGGEGFGNGR